MFTILVFAIGLRIAAWLGLPALRLLVVLFALVTIYSFLFRGRR